MKKFIIFSLMLILVLSIAGCSSSSPSTSSTNASQPDAAPIKMGRVEYAAHGTKCFTVAVVALQGDKIVGASIDDYQFMSKDVAKGVPNSDSDFGKNYADPNMVLASKRANAEYYSEHMKEEAGATTPINKSFDAIEAYVTGKTISELEDILAKNSPEQMVDAVSGATLVDTKGYISAIVAAAKVAAAR
ncbi:hypothetical protein [Calorimonas adulescens]|jgi:hypothetical protein|uniref:FMN-binding protein n=1 Tax=Calorimonas adulescens TaxID=2606906 RepID=A0A5D8QEK5_9THEO|nr:hypothetical protein [Calorimonas adulescens]TZE81678.1 hypothetical protein FWJ32_07995 [Calorimonas adulescens]